MRYTQNHNLNISRLISGFMLFFVLSACAGTTKSANSLLWKISGNGLSSPSYLFGTHHLVPITFLDEIMGLEDAYNSVEQIVGELDMNDMINMQMQIMQKAILPQEYNYKELLDEDDYQLLTNLVKESLGMDFAMLERMKPAMINNLLMITQYQKYYPTTEDIGIDQHFQDKAREANISVKGLEAINDQVYLLLESQTIERQTDLLMCSIKHPELLKDQMDKLQNAYLTQNIAAITDLYYEKNEDSPCESTENEKHLMNGARNAKWLEILPEIIKDKPSFVAVGCLHLVGQEGLIEGLRTMGYNVEPVLK